MYFYCIQSQSTGLGSGRIGIRKMPGRVTKQAGMKAENSRSNRAANVRLAADIGGTFTDIAGFDDKTGRVTFGKALSTPDRLGNGISNGVGKGGCNYASANLFLDGSAVGTHTRLER